MERWASGPKRGKQGDREREREGGRRGDAGWTGKGGWFRGRKEQKPVKLTWQNTGAGGVEVSLMAARTDRGKDGSRGER